MCVDKPKLFRRHNSLYRFLFLGVGVLMMATYSPPSEADLSICGTLDRQFGVWDYANPAHRARYLNTVENRHFTERIRTLAGGETGPTPGGDLSYTLTWFPNHYQALDAMSRLSRQERTLQPRGSRHNLECWFDRAIRFRPEDAMVRVVQAFHHERWRQTDKAREAALAASALQPDDPETNYNLGLILVRLGEHELAHEHAKTAYAMGYPMPGLRNLLRQAGFDLDG